MVIFQYDGVAHAARALSALPSLVAPIVWVSMMCLIVAWLIQFLLILRNGCAFQM